MGFSTQEALKLTFKVQAGGVIDAASGNQWYESVFPFNPSINANRVLTQFDTVLNNPAQTFVNAQAAATNHPSIIKDHWDIPIRLTQVTQGDGSTWVSYETYDDRTSDVLDLWIQPQKVPKPDGFPSIGYGVRLFNGDPTNGGVEITTTQGQSGGEVGWVFNYDMGMLFIANDLNNNLGTGFEPWIRGFRYIGETLADSSIGGGTIVNFEDTETIGFTQSGDTYSAFIKPDSITVSNLKTVDGFATASYLLSNDGLGNFKWVEGGDVLLYQNSDIVPEKVGGIDVGSSFSTPTPIQDVLDQLLYPELFPILTAPSSTFTSNVIGLREIGSTWSITFTSGFNRGSISPQYQSDSPFRSGLPNSYEYTGVSIVGTYSSVSLSDTRSISNYEVISGNQNWTGKVNYDAGVQPKSNKGNDVGSPLPAGSTNFITRTITGVYPFFATSVNIGDLTKQTLVAHDGQTLSGYPNKFFQINLVATVGLNRQKFQIPSVFSTIVSVRVFNSTSNQYEFPGGSAQSSLTWFAANYLTSSVSINVNSNAQNISYVEYISPVGESIGARQIRLNTN